MGQIYASAWRVVAWLGSEDQEGFAEAVDLGNLLNRDSEKNRYYIQARPQCPMGPPIWVNDATNAKLSMDPETLPGETNHHLGWLSWNRIFYRTYWSRLDYSRVYFGLGTCSQMCQRSDGLGSCELYICSRTRTSCKVPRRAQRRASTSFLPSQTAAANETKPWQMRSFRPLRRAIPYPPAEVW
jgi:hypothetical protein